MTTWISADVDPVNVAKDKPRFLALIPEDKANLHERDYSVVFCVLHDQPDFSLKMLPFMSRYELMQSHRFLTGDRNFKVGIVFRQVILGP